MNHDIGSDVVDGFPFKNEDIFGKKSDPGIKSHLEDLAKKHPEFAGDLQRPLWEDPLSTNWDNAFTVPVSVEKPVADHDRPSSSQSKPSETEVDSQQATAESSNSEPINQETMNDHQQNAKEPKRFTSKIEITPVNPYEESAAEQGRQSQPGTPNSARKQPQVRHIPIFVEGRSEPVVPKNTAGNFHSTNQFPPQHEQQIPIKRKFDNSTEHSGPAKQEERTQQQIPVHVEKTRAGKPAAEKHEPEPPKQTEKPPPSQKLDPLGRISQVQQEVDELAAQVEKFNGTSRTEKAYLYLDEMLTRNLIKLDTVEVEGNEKLRLARKDVIKSIQKAISMLESKVPVPTPTEQQDQVEEANQNESSSNADEPMEGDDQSRRQNDPQNQNNDGGGQPK